VNRLKTYETFNNEINVGDYLTCVFSDHEGFDYGKQYKVKEMSASKMTISVYNNYDWRIFFYVLDNATEKTGTIVRTWSDGRDDTWTDGREKVILFNGTLEEYNMKKDAETYNL
jgi:hypothetical protein